MNVVSLLPSATEIVAALGLLDHLVGVTHSCDFPAVVRRLPRVTSTTIPKDAPSREIDRAVRERMASGAPLYTIDVELLERLGPDVLITQGICDVCAVCEMQALAVVPRLSRSVEVVNLVPHRFDDVLEDVLHVGRATGAERRAGQLVTAYRDRVSAVRERTAGRRPVSVVVLEWIDPLFSSGHWTPDVVALAGGIEVLAHPGARSRALEWEEVRKADPEVLVLACCGHDELRTLRDWGHLCAQPGFSRLNCVREGRVYVADGGAYFSRPGPRLVDAVERLAESLHPSRAPGARALSRAPAAWVGSV